MLIEVGWERRDVVSTDALGTNAVLRERVVAKPW